MFELFLEQLQLSKGNQKQARNIVILLLNPPLFNIHRLSLKFGTLGNSK